mgnify:CR=1 FL=1
MMKIRFRRFSASIGAAETRGGHARSTGEDSRKKSLQVISKSLFVLYESLRKSKGGVAVTVVKGGICDGCRIALSSSNSQRVAETNELPRCGSCQRILYAI